MHIGIVGLGLIGGSLGLDFVQQGHRVSGIARRAATCQLALERRAVTQADSDYGLLEPAEVVFICTPIDRIVPTLVAIAPHLAPSTVITDVGSVKAPIVAAAQAQWPHFIGGHPMAGKATAGLEAASPGLFHQRPYVLTPTATTQERAVNLLMPLIQDLGAISYSCAPDIHDRAVAWISHLPVMVSSSLISACLQEDANTLELAKKLASSGFADTSRVGGGVPELGLMMARYNRPALLDALRLYQQNLAAVADLIEAEDWPQLEQHFARTQTARPEFLT